MLTEIDEPPGTTAASLLSGILGDLQRLVEQQFQLTRREIEDEVRKHYGAGVILFCGMAMLFLSSMEFCLTAAHWLHWITSPVGTDVASLPLWGCHAVIALVLLVLGGTVTVIGRAKFNAIQATPNPVTEISKEREKWTTHPQ
jgi:hypothetical protein